MYGFFINCFKLWVNDVFESHLILVFLEEDRLFGIDSFGLEDRIFDIDYSMNYHFLTYGK